MTAFLTTGNIEDENGKRGPRRGYNHDPGALPSSVSQRLKGDDVPSLPAKSKSKYSTYDTGYRIPPNIRRSRILRGEEITASKDGM